MKKIFFILFASVFLISCLDYKRADIETVNAAIPTSGSDKFLSSYDFYDSVAEIRRQNRENVDFSIKYELRSSYVAIFAIHGGDIERGTSEIAEKIAGEDWSYYFFEGYGEDAKKYHVTSAKFDDLTALEIAAASKLGISFHAQRGTGEQICVGGANTEAAALVARNLTEAGFPTEYPCRRMPGRSPVNIVNRPCLHGVQLEITQSLLDKLAIDSVYSDRFRTIIRNSLETYIAHMVSGV